MRRNTEQVTIFFEIMLLSSSLVFATNYCYASSDVITNSDMEGYGQAFMKGYNKTLEDNFKQEYRKYFSFYADYPYILNVTISTNQGAAIEFVPSNEVAFESRTINYRIDLGVFTDVDLNITSLDAQNATVLIYSGPPGSFLTLNSGATAVFSDMVIITNKGHFAELKEGSLLILSHVIVNERLYHIMITRGSNSPSAWTVEEAEKDAKEIFNIDLYRAFNMSEEIREYLAYPELSKLIGQIVWKYQHAKETGYDLIAFEGDLAQVRDLAVNKYHVKTEFVDEILNYLEGINAVATPPFWEAAPWSWIFGGLVGVAITAICTMTWKSLKGKQNRRRSRKWAKRASSMKNTAIKAGFQFVEQEDGKSYYRKQKFMI